MAGEWYVGRNGQQSGPFSQQQLRQMAVAGQLSPADLLWKEGMPNWVPCSSVKGLFLQSAAISAPSPRASVSGESYGDPDLTGNNNPASSTTLYPDVFQPPAAIQIQYADFLPRVGAFLLDGLFVGLMGCVPGCGIGLVLGAITASSPDPDYQLIAGVLSNFCSSVVNILISVIYYVTLETSAKQGTWGKQIVGIKVTDLQGNRITIGRAVGRYFAKFITGCTCGIGMLMPLFTDKKQTLHDMIAGCLSLKK